MKEKDIIDKIEELVEQFPKDSENAVFVVMGTKDGDKLITVGETSVFKDLFSGITQASPAFAEIILQSAFHYLVVNDTMRINFLMQIKQAVDKKKAKEKPTIILPKKGIIKP